LPDAGTSADVRVVTSRDFRLAPERLDEVGQGLVRPECVLATATGALYVSHFGGGVTRLGPEGRRTDLLGPGDPVVATNGFALTPEGDFLCASLMPPGGVWRVTRDGRQAPFLLEVEGRRLPPCNFVAVDRWGRVWITLSTWLEPRARAYRPDTADGCIVLVDRAGARIVAEGLGYTNEAILDPTGGWLYVNETFGRRTTRFRVAADGALSQREVVAEYGAGTFPDGLAFDEAGGLWVVSVVSNRVIRVTPDGRQQLILEDADEARLAEVESAFRDGRMGRPHLDRVASRRLKNISSIAFGGPDRRTAYLGNLLDDRIYSFRSPVAGAAPAHWSFDP
jgi:sugar lactone lactonase YvrE